MPKFSVIVSERVTVCYPPVIVDAEDYAAAADQVEALRRDRALGDPSSEIVQDASFEVTPQLDTDPAPDAGDPQFIVTALGRLALTTATDALIIETALAEARPPSTEDAAQ
jgi:hypothetical protein